MEDRKKAKRFLYSGAVIGGILALTITVLMDSLFANSLQGTWRDAIAKDLNSLFHLGVTPDSILVYLLFLVVLVILGGFGAFMGFIFSFFLYRFFQFLGSR